MIIVKELFDPIFNNFYKATNEPYVEHPIAGHMRHELPDYFKNLDFIDYNKYKVKGSPGQNDWTSVPWIGIKNKNFGNESFTDDYYVVYLFKSNKDDKKYEGVYLSLNFGASEFKKKFKSKNLNKAAELFRDILKNKYSFVGDFDDNMDLGENEHFESSPKKDYEDGDIFSIYYPADDFPTEEKVQEDLKLFLDLYDYLYEQRGNVIFTEQELEDLDIEIPSPQVHVNPEYNTEGVKMNSEGPFYNYLTKKGFYFNQEIIENYLLSLKVKPFVILTGNSGTGKTKLSQLFAKYINKNEITVEDEYITFKTKYASVKHEYFYIGRKTVSALLDLHKYEGMADFYFDDIKSRERIVLDIRAGCDDEKLIDHLRLLGDDLSDIEIKINKKDLYDTFLDNENIEKTDELTFERKIGTKPSWSLPKEDFHKLLPVKNEYTWKAIIDGIETSLDYWIHSFKVYAENQDLIDYINQKTENDTIKIKVDYSSLKPKEDDSDWEIDFINGNIEDYSKKEKNYEIIPVGANWTDNRNIFGFFNVISKHYKKTTSLDLIKKAERNPNYPFFLILDEMNLSHVERYFADFLSAIESKEAIPLYSKGSDVEEKEIDPALEIPKNLFVIGTVNVDETTYMFSPKVLDRANVLEFETFSEYFTIKKFMDETYRNIDPDENNEKQGKFEYLENPLSDLGILDKPMSKLKEKLELLELNNISEDLDESSEEVVASEGSDIDIISSEDLDESSEEVVASEGSDVDIISSEDLDESSEEDTSNTPFKTNDDYKNVWEALSGELQEIHQILKKPGFDFGFRVVKEVLCFMYVASVYESCDKDEEPNWEFNWERYFDAQIKQKILPKIHGSKKVLGTTLDDLLRFCLKDWDKDKELPKVDEITKANAKYYTSAKKLAEMRDVLESQRYVSFIN